jgi:SAM-dependent methyltransferase
MVETSSPGKYSQLPVAIELEKLNFVMKNKNSGCLICGMKDFKVVANYSEPDQYELAVGIEITNGYWRKWVRCTNCGFYYSLYSRDQRVLDNIYATSYRGEDVEWRNNSNEDVFHKIVGLPVAESETKLRVKWIKDYLACAREAGFLVNSTAPYKILDIGGGTGIFAYEFQDEAWESYVIDADPSGGFIETELGITFLPLYYKPNSFSTSFDLISLIFVLEHLADPVEILEQLKLDLSNRGLVYIEVPDAVCFDLKLQDDDIFNSCHLWMFSPNTLVKMLSQTGFEICAMQRIRTIRGHYSIMILAHQKDCLKKTVDS